MKDILIHWSNKEEAWIIEFRANTKTTMEEMVDRIKPIVGNDFIIFIDKERDERRAEADRR